MVVEEMEVEGPIGGTLVEGMVVEGSVDTANKKWKLIHFI